MVSINLVYGVVLAGALLHATWNALIKGSADTFLSAVGITVAAALMAACVLPWFTPPARAAWPFLGVSLILQLTYMGLVARVYRVADMASAYPIMRGTAPLAVTIVSLVLFGDTLGMRAVIGIAIICAGILCMGSAPAGTDADGRGPRLALLTALVIAAYTLVDGTGARRSGAPVAYTLWLFLLQGAGMFLAGLRWRRPALLHALRAQWRANLLGGFGTMASYGTALWAMTLAPIAVIAALRETAILFGVLISALVLHERLGWARALGAGTLVLGAIVLRLA